MGGKLRKSGALKREPKLIGYFYKNKFYRGKDRNAEETGEKGKTDF